jgi:branched-chain amino acid transport system ATP-binding protein
MNVATMKREAISAATEADPSQAFFAVRDIHAYYGESYIVQGVTLDVKKGEILALLGRNGAGKTSTLRTIARMDDPQLRSGEIWLEGKPLHTMKSWQASRAGIQLVPEDRRIIPGMTVEENLVLAQVAPGHGMSIEELYEHMLAVARALAREVKLLLLDEPYEGLAPVIVREIETIVHGIKERGITTIIVEQNAVAALRLADRAVILDTGELVFAGAAKELLESEELRNEYLAI